MSERGRPLSLWGSWWNAIELLRPAFSRLSTFLWFATIVAGMTVRSDMLGVTSIVRALNLRPTLYHRLLAHFHSTGVKLDRLTALWAQVVLRLFPTALRVNGRLILIGDGIKCPKRDGCDEIASTQLSEAELGVRAIAKTESLLHVARPRGEQLLRRTARRTHP